MLIFLLENLVLNKPARQSSTYYYNDEPWHAELAVDGETDSCSHTEEGPQAWWAVDLQSTYTLYHVTLTNRKTLGKN